MTDNAATLSLSMRLNYGVGQLSEGVKSSAFSTFLFFYYNQVLGLSGSLAGLAALIALMVDAVTDPMVGQASDRLKSRWGRRHPFMLAGAVPFCFAMVALFSPPQGLSEMQLFGWMLGGAILVRLAITLFFVPHLSLGAELVSDYHQKTSLIGYRIFFAYFGALLASVIGFAVFFPPTEAFPNGMLNSASYPRFGLFCGVLGTLAMLATVFGTRKSIPHLRQPAEHQTGGNPLLAVINVFKTLRQKSFRILFISVLCFVTLSGAIQTLLIYVATFVFGFGPEHLAGLAAALVIGIIFASPLAQWLSRRFDKKNALALCLIFGCLIAFTPQFAYFSGAFEVMPFNLKFVLVFFCSGFSQVFFIAYIILLDSMLSDIIDEHEANSGLREEGLFFAARSFATKASYGLGSFIAGIGLDIIDFPQSAAAEAVPEAAIFKLAVLSGPVLFVLFISTCAISNRYPLNQQRHREVMAQISARAKTADIAPA
ncbi:MAG: MFS transporter [Halioglobus sp.]